MLTLFLANLVGWIRSHWHILLIALGILIVLIAVLFISKSCGKRQVKMDLDTVNKINTANETQRKAELQKVIEANQDVVTTVGNRSNVAETNVVERDKEIDAKVKEVDKRINDAHAQGHDVTQTELEALLTGGTP